MSKENANWKKFNELIKIFKEAGASVEINYGFDSALATIKTGCAELEIDVSDSYFEISTACSQIQNVFKSIG